MSGVLLALGALAPPVGVGLLFWWAIRAIMNADRSERAALARMDARTAEPGTGTTEPQEQTGR